MSSGHVTALLRELQTLECELHRIETRRDRRRLDELLHPEFMEIGRSGRRYGRDEILAEFSAEGDLPPVHACDFEVADIGPGVALLTYRSAHIDPQGKLYRRAARASVWVRTARGWQVRFHQGTPAERDAPNDNTNEGVGNGAERRR